MAAAWGLLSVAACVFWSLWGFFGVLAERRLAAEAAFNWHCLAVAACGCCAAPFVGLSLPLDQMSWMLAGGAGYAGAAIWMIQAINAGGPGGIVVTLTAMYPVVNVLLTVLFLHQTLSFVQLAGVALAVVAIACVTEGKCHEPDGDEEDRRLGTGPGDKTADPASAMWWLFLCLLSMLGNAMSAFSPEVCATLPSAEGLPATAVGSRLVWQAAGCTLTCLACIPCCSADTKPAAPASCSESDPLLGPKSAAELLNAGVGSALAMGVTVAAGFAAYNMAVAVAPAEALSAIVLISGLYPALTVVLARVLLDERLSLRQYSGIVLALVAARLVA